MSNRNNNPRKLMAGHFTAQIGLSPTFSAFVACYTHSIERLYRAISEGPDTADIAALPLLYLMRHTLELGYKCSLVHLCSRNSTVFNPEKKNGERHSLKKLHERLGLEHAIAVKKGIAPEPNKGFDDYYVLTEKGMGVLDGIDERSTKLRFPKIDESSAFEHDTVVNLLEVKNAFDAAMILLDTVADMLDREAYC